MVLKLAIEFSVSFRSYSLSSESECHVPAVLSGQIGIPYAYKLLMTMRNLSEFLAEVVGGILEEKAPIRF